MSDKPTSKDLKRTSSKQRRYNPGKKIRIARLIIQNFKALDNLEIDLPAPRMEDDPDIFVMGSRNGLGKTSFLEACFFLFLAGIADEENLILNRYLGLEGRRYLDTPIDLPDLMVRAGSEHAHIEGNFAIGSKQININLSLGRNGHIFTKGDKLAFQELVMKTAISPTYVRDIAARFSLLLAGLNSDPVILAPFMYFHSYRKVQEGSLELGMMVEGERFRRYRSRSDLAVPISTFKLEVLRSLMSRGGLFEDLDDSEANDVLNKLNDLMKQYAAGYIEKLRPSPDNTIEFRITPSNGGPSFTFDGLSSGQKEIISTLFLIWRYTQKQPGIILIDEPELHLNPEWHRAFIRHLHQLAPNNQYILATHSEDVVSAVDKDRRILLVSDKKEV